MAEKGPTNRPNESTLTSSPSGAERGSPFGLLQRFSDEIDRVFDDFGFNRGGFGPRRVQWPSLFERASQATAWNPAVEVFQRGSELVVRADLPGLRKDDVKVELKDDGIVIQGERRREHTEEHGTFYSTERSYGSFERWIALPEGAMTDQAKATFKNGVLEVTMPAPPDPVTRGRRLEISEPRDVQK